MDIQSAELNKLFVLFPVIIPGWVTPVKPDGIAHGGIPKALYDDQARGLECLVDPWTELQQLSWTMAADDRVDLYCNGNLVPGAGQTVKPGEEQLRQRLYLPHGYLKQGVNRLHYVVTRVSGNNELSRDLLVLYHLRSADSLDLVIPADVLKGGVSAARAAQGVEFEFTYANGRSYDRIELRLGDAKVEFDVPDGTAPIAHTLFTDTFREAGDNPKAVAEFYVIDQLDNRVKSPEKRLDIDLDRVELEKAILREIPTENNDAPAIVDLAKLNGGPLWALIHLIEKIWSMGDEIYLTFTALVNGSPVASHEATLPITWVPGQFSWGIPNSKVIADSTVRVSYEQIRGGKVIATSKDAEANVIGEAAPNLLPAFLVAPAKNPIESSLYPEGVKVRVEHLTAQEGDKARLDALNALPGTPEFATVKLNQNKRANFTLSPELLKAHQGRNLRLRWVLIRKGSMTPSPELRLRISAPVATLTFDNDPYTLAPAGRFTVRLALAKNGVDLPDETVELSLPKDFTFSDNVGGSRRFITDKDGKITVNGVKGHTAPGAYSLTALHGNQTVTGVATVTPQTSVGTIPGIPYPYNIAISPDGTRAYVVSTSHPANYGALTVVDTATHRVTGSIALGRNVSCVAVSPDNSRVYITRGGVDSLNNVLTVVDTTSLNIIRNVSFTGYAPFGVAISPDGSRAYLCGGAYPFTGYPNGRLAVVDTARFETLHTLVLQNNASEVTVSPDGSRVYAANANGNGTAGSGTVSVIDTSTYSVISNIGVGSNPHGIVVSRDGTRIYTVRTDVSLLVVIDARTHAVIHNIPIGLGAWQLALSPDGKSLCASEWDNGKAIVIVDTTTFSVRRIPAGRDSAGVAFSSDSTRIYICNYTDNNVWVVGN